MRKHVKPWIRKHIQDNPTAQHILLHLYPPEKRNKKKMIAAIPKMGNHGNTLG